MSTLDFRQCSWGHNLELIRNDGNGDMEFWVWSTPGPRVNDHVIWKTDMGSCVGVVTASEWTGNVSDMYRITTKVTERWLKDGTLYTGAVE